MAYVAPTTRSDGYVVPASVWNSDVVNNPIALKALIDALPTTVDNSTADGRLTLTSATPVTTSDVTAATTLYWALYEGNRIALYTGSAWVVLTVSELSIAVPATTSQMYDVFVNYNSGTPALSLTAWTNDTTRATALTTQDGVLVLTGTTGKRYVGSMRTTTVSGQTEDSVSKRFVWNYDHRQPRDMVRSETNTLWTYNTATIRQVRASALNQVEFIIGVSEGVVDATYTNMVDNDNATLQVHRIGLGLDSTTAYATNSLAATIVTGPSLSNQVAGIAQARLRPAVGYHYLAALEYSTVTGTSRFFGAQYTNLEGIRAVVLG